MVCSNAQTAPRQPPLRYPAQQRSPEGTPAGPALRGPLSEPTLMWAQEWLSWQSIMLQVELGTVHQHNNNGSLGVLAISLASVLPILHHGSTQAINAGCSTQAFKAGWMLTQSV